jgi:hypothetical protein
VFAGQQTAVANEIRRNLGSYADTQLLEELTQNADDAGATRAAFMLDQRAHATKKVEGIWARFKALRCSVCFFGSWLQLPYL